MAGFPAFALLLLLGSTAFARAAEPARAVTAPAPEPRRLSFGINGPGAQLRLHVARDWAVEARVQSGSSSSNEGSVQALAFGMRGYRFFRERRRCRLYLGLEGAYAQATLQNVDYKSNGSQLSKIKGFGEMSGYAAGGFGGIEYRPLRRVALDIDMGPYLIGLKEKITGASTSSWDIVVNTALNVYIF